MPLYGSLLRLSASTRGIFEPRPKNEVLVEKNPAVDRCQNRKVRSKAKEVRKMLKEESIES